MEKFLQEDQDSTKQGQSKKKKLRRELTDGEAVVLTIFIFILFATAIDYLINWFFNGL